MERVMWTTTKKNDNSKFKNTPLFHAPFNPRYHLSLGGGILQICVFLAGLPTSWNFTA
jgi:hypothetical protein